MFGIISRNAIQDFGLFVIIIHNVYIEYGPWKFKKKNYGQLTIQDNITI